MAAFVANKDAERALKIINSDKAGSGASLIGEVERNGGKSVLLASSIGATRIVDMFSGGQLPRIC